MYNKWQRDLIEEFMSEMMKDELKRKTTNKFDKKDMEKEGVEQVATATSKLYQAFIDKGFDKQQAFDLTKAIIERSL